MPDPIAAPTPTRRNPTTARPANGAQNARPVEAQNPVPQIRLTAQGRPAPQGASRRSERRTVTRVSSLPGGSPAPAIVVPAIGSKSLRVRHTSRRAERQDLQAPPAVEVVRTAQELANLAARREFRDEMVSKYQAGPAGAAFKDFGVALKGEGKFAPLDPATRAAVTHAARAHAAALISMRMKSAGLQLTGVDIELLQNQVRKWPNYGKEDLSLYRADKAANQVIKNVHRLRQCLAYEIKSELFLSEVYTHNPDGTPATLVQELADMGRRDAYPLRVFEDDKVELRHAFRKTLSHDNHERRIGESFCRSFVPKYLSEKRGIFAIWAMMPRLPRELAYLIAAMVRAVIHRGF